MYGEWLDDEKVQMMPDHLQARLVRLFCLRSMKPTETLHETQLAFRLRISITELAETKAVFMANGFIDDAWTVLNWNKRQYASDSSTERVREHRRRLEQVETLHETGETKNETPPDTEQKQKQNRTEQKKQVAPLALPDWLPLDAWQGFAEMRKRIKAPLTDRGVKLTIAALDRLRVSGQDPGAVLDQSTQHNWRGVFEVKQNGGYASGRPTDRANPSRRDNAETRLTETDSAIEQALRRRGIRVPGAADEGDERRIPTSDPQAVNGNLSARMGASGDSLWPSSNPASAGGAADHARPEVLSPSERSVRSH